MFASIAANALKTISEDDIRGYVRDYMTARPEAIPALVEKVGRLYTIVSEEAVRHGREIQP